MAQIKHTEKGGGRVRFKLKILPKQFIAALDLLTVC